MRFRQILALCGVLWLAGCATLDTDTASSTPASGGTSVATAPKPVTAKPKPKPQAAAQNEAEAVKQDLWDRVRAGFAMQDLEGDLVSRQEQWYSTRPDYIQRMTERSSRYLYHVVEEIERRGMPMELALLPFIESAFNPMAVSSAKAAGMWQFMPATGTYFDLTQNMFRDDRRDILASTQAALDYLEKLHRMFGDWHLALAAYNWGEGNVLRAIKRNQNAGLGTSYTELTMPTETRMYVPKLQAVKNIVASPDAFSVELAHIENHPYFQVVEIKRDIDAELVAQLADVRIEDFRALNPSLNKPVILAAGTPQVLLPWDNAEVFKRNLAAYDDGQYASWTVWVVPSTMTVADAAQRVGMSETELRAINPIPPRMLIKSGSALMVPRTAKHKTDVSGHLAEHAKLVFAPEVTTVTRRSAVQVRRGDNMTTLARRHKVSVADLARWNSINTSARLRAGQSLNIYVPVRVANTKALTSSPRVASKARAPSKTSKTAKAAPTKSRKAPQVAKNSRNNKVTVAQAKRGGNPAKRER